MSVSLSPSNSLGFNRPLTTLVKRPLTITNHNAQPVAFKVKTTAPTLYCVRPNSGRLNPGQSFDVSVMLQPLKVEPPLNAKCKDKFLVQSTLITPGKEATPLQDIWIRAEDASGEDKVHHQKLRVTYLPAQGQTLMEEDEEETEQANPVSMMRMAMPQNDTARLPPSVSGETQFASGSRLSTVPPGEFSAAREETHQERRSLDVHNVAVIPPEPLVPTSKPEPEPIARAARLIVHPEPSILVAKPDLERDAHSSVNLPLATPELPVPVKSTYVVPPPPLTPTVDAHTDKYADRYAEAQAEITRLRAMLAALQPPAEPRRRTIDPSNSTVAVQTETPDQEGVSLEVVVIIAFGVFITTYLFF
ncbi:PapD-like protein [Mycena belliarum]|uniref:PapD-like protein n=1 Tax=Mycena belliarum TaxID=1033014 RepID=A0AAD6U984_9AGAR|nr:PapD-like protein [Mycena belliae]